MIHAIINSVNKVNALMEQISVASEEQSRGIGQVGQAVTEMDGVTQQNAALVQESAAAAAFAGRAGETPDPEHRQLQTAGTGIIPPCSP